MARGRHHRGCADSSRTRRRGGRDLDPSQGSFPNVRRDSGYRRSVTNQPRRPRPKPGTPDLIDLLGAPGPPPKPLSDRRRRAPRRLGIAGVVLIVLSIVLDLLGLKGLVGTVSLLGTFCLLNAGFYALANRMRLKREQQTADRRESEPTARRGVSQR
jgi:hypothetical protein